MFGASEEIRVEHLQNNAINIVEMICSVISQPVEIILRPRYGTRYFPVPVTFFSAALMLLLPALMMLFTNFMQMMPMLHAPARSGMFGLSDFAKVYFVLMPIHGVRLWLRMIHMDSEAHSQYEGPALPFFALLPKGSSFWFTRIVLEPAFVLVVAIVLQDLSIAQADLSLYLRLAALTLLVKNWVAWFRAWEFLRITKDQAYAAPVINKLAKNEATEDELATIHVASFPKNVPADIRKTAAEQIARAYSPENTDL